MEGKDPGRVRGRSAGRYEILVPTQLVQVQVNEETYIRGLTKTGVLGRCGSVAQRGIQRCRSCWLSHRISLFDSTCPDERTRRLGQPLQELQPRGPLPIGGAA